MYFITIRLLNNNVKEQPNCSQVTFVFSFMSDVPDDILDQLKKLKDGLDAINKWKEEVNLVL